MRRALTLAAALALVLAACGGDDGESSATSAGESTVPTEASATTGGDGQFPVTVSHKYGETTVEAEPERVVSIGFVEQDFLLALGVTPIAVREWYGEQPFATWPWAQDELGDAEPEVLSSADLNFEQIAALQPDLIVGISAGLTEEQYETLAAIAPTLAQSGDYVDYGTPWDVTTEMIGDAVGRPEEAAAVIEHVESLYAETRAAHPEFDGATATVGFWYQDMPGAYSSQDGRARILTDIGFVTPDEFDQLAGDAFYFSVSSEDISVLDTDVIIWLGSTDEEIDAILSMPTRPSLAAYSEGREVLPSVLVAGAFSFASPLSIEYLLEELVPELALAVDGDPATVVPSLAAAEGGVATSTTTGSATSTTAAATTGSTQATTSGAAFDAEQQEVADIFAKVFDSNVTFADKRELIEDADALQSTIENYTTSSAAMGGISLVPKAVAITGDSATVVYDVMFGDQVAYSDLDREIVRVDGNWIVPRAEFCGFMASAQNACPA